MKVATFGLFFLVAYFVQDPRWLVLGLALGWCWDPFHKITAPLASTPGRGLLVLSLGAGLAYAAGFRVAFVHGVGGAYWALGAWGLPLTVLWVVLVARSLQFVREQGSDRLLLQVAWVVCAAFLAVELLQPQALPFAITLAVLVLLGLSWALWRGVVLSTLGSYGLGLLLALLTIAGMVKTGAGLALLSPVLVLGLPPLTFNAPLGIAALAPSSRRRPARMHHLLALYVWLSVFSVVVLSAERLGVAFSLIALGLGTLWGAMVFVLGSQNWSTSWYACSNRVRLFGVPVDRLNARQAVERIERWIASGRNYVVATPDTTALFQAQFDPTWRACYERADVVTADGTGVVWASRWLGSPLPERVTGIDLMQRLCQQAAQRGQRVFLLGARPGVVERAARHLRRSYAGLNVVGTHHGYFGNGERALVERIHSLRPDLLFVGLGVPYQERWLLEHRRALGAKVAMGVGGSFDVLAGCLPRAPRWVQRAGVEWLYRLCLEPRRLGRALLIPQFMCAVLGLKLWLWFQQVSGSTTSASSS